MQTTSCWCTTRHRHNRWNSTSTRLETSRRRMIFWVNRLRFSNSWTRLRTLLAKTSKATKQRAGCHPINLASNSSSCSRKPRPTQLIEELKINRWQMQSNLTWHSEMLALLEGQSKTSRRPSAALHQLLLTLAKALLAPSSPKYIVKQTSTPEILVEMTGSKTQRA